jgi:hypothetical protein
MDDARIAQLREEVVSQLRRAADPVAGADLESRVAALEAAVGELQQQGPRPATPAPGNAGGPRAHPSLQVLHVAGGATTCVLEPDKPCVQSHACRTFGH